MTTTNRHEVAAEALARATSGRSFGNYPAIFDGFAAKGIAADDIQPRENVFTYHAWRAKGRQVRRGEKGVRVVTFVPMTKKTEDDDGETTRQNIGRRPRAATVFHVSQTDPMEG